MTGSGIGDGAIGCIAGIMTCISTLKGMPGNIITDFPSIFSFLAK
jgi:hypothetical protein